jgi:hypothetical protein
VSVGVKRCLAMPTVSILQNAAIDCGALPTVANATIKLPLTTLYNSSAAYACDGDYRHEDGLQVKTIHCTGNGHWSEVNMTCGRKFSMPQ